MTKNRSIVIIIKTLLWLYYGYLLLEIKESTDFLVSHKKIQIENEKNNQLIDSVSSLMKGFDKKVEILE